MSPVSSRPTCMRLPLHEAIHEGFLQVKPCLHGWPSSSLRPGGSFCLRAVPTPSLRPLPSMSDSTVPADPMESLSHGRLCSKSPPSALGHLLTESSLARPLGIAPRSRRRDVASVASGSVSPLPVSSSATSSTTDASATTAKPLDGFVCNSQASLVLSSPGPPSPVSRTPRPGLLAFSQPRAFPYSQDTGNPFSQELLLGSPSITIQLGKDEPALSTPKSPTNRPNHPLP